MTMNSAASAVNEIAPVSGQEPSGDAVGELLDVACGVGSLGELSAHPAISVLPALARRARRDQPEAMFGMSRHVS